jgi:hypothetical protein
MRMKNLVGAALAAALLTPASIWAQTQTAVFSNPDKQFETIGKVNAEQRVIVVPTLQVKWMTYGKVSKTASPHVFQQNTRSARSTTEVIGSVNPATLQALTDGLYADLVAQLKAAGWKVVTAADLGTTAPKWAAMDVDADGLANDTFTYDAERRYAIAAPGGMPILKTVGGGKFLAPTNGMGINKLARDHNALILVPTYVFDTAELDQSTRQGFNNVTATTAATASLLIGGSANVSAPRGMLTLSLKAPVAVAEDIGTLQKVDPSNKDSGFTSAMRFLGGLAKVSKAAYTLVPDDKKLGSEATRAGAAFNAEIVRRLN